MGTREERAGEWLAAGCALFLLAGLAGCGARASATESEPPNVLLVLLDDLTWNALGCTGNGLVETPNIDRLAKEGMRFERAYVPIPQCAPSRAALLLGLYPHATGVITNPGAWRRDRPTLGQALSARGYRAGMIGKWHLGRDAEPQAGFDAGWAAIDRNHFAYFDPPLWVDGESRPHPGFLPDVLTDLAIDFIDAEDEAPFLLWLAYRTPHEPLTAPPDASLRVEASRVQLAASTADDLSGKPAPQRDGVCHSDFLERGPERVRRDLALYYAMIGAVDRSFGRLLAHLEERGLEDDTLIVFLSDNGVLFGEHQMVAKGPAFYEELVRTPLILRWPGHVPAGARSQALVSTLDLYPTLAGLAGASYAGPGQDLWPLVTGAQSSVRDALFLEYGSKPTTGPMPMLGVVTADRKYVRYLGTGEEELYDLVADPGEVHNLAGAGTHDVDLDRLRRRLDAFAQTIEQPFW